MKKINFLVFNNQILTDLLNEVKNFNFNSHIFIKKLDSFSELKKISYDDSNILLISYEMNDKSVEQLTILKIPILYITKKKQNNVFFKNSNNFIIEEINMPFKIVDLISKAQILLSKSKFQEKSIISFLNFKLDQNKREIVKKNNTLKLTEREVNFLLYLKNANSPVDTQSILNNVWGYSNKTETHTVETHVHRLRKKFLDSFGENNIIKSRKEGYYI